MAEENIIGIFETEKVAKGATAALQGAGYKPKSIAWKRGGAGHAQSERIVGELEKMGVPGVEGELYVRNLKHGNAIIGLTAKTGDDAEKIIGILADNGADNLRARSINRSVSPVLDVEEMGALI
jgi:hypothetical protein